MLTHRRQLKQDCKEMFADDKSLLMKAERDFLNLPIKIKTKRHAQLYIMAKLHKKKLNRPCPIRKLYPPLVASTTGHPSGSIFISTQP